MRAEDREALRRRFGFQCGYCGVSETEVGSELTLDHYRPRSHNAPDEPENWVYCCFACNTNKSDVWAPDSEQRILHPLRDDLSEHIAEQPDGVLVGLTGTGRFHVAQLQLNRPPLVLSRLRRSARTRLLAALDEARCHQDALRRQVESLEETVAEAERRLGLLGGPHER